MKPTEQLRFNTAAFLAVGGPGKTIEKYREKQVCFSQADPADTVCYLQRGRVKLTVVSNDGKEAVIAILGAGAFFGEACLTGRTVRMANAVAMSDCTVMCLDKAVFAKVLHDEPAFSELFISCLLHRTIRVEADLIDQLFNSSEKRLARLLLRLASSEPAAASGAPRQDIAKMSQEEMAEIVGTTRSRVSFFMNRFRKLGFIEYNSGGMRVYSSRLKIVLRDAGAAGASARPGYEHLPESETVQAHSRG